MRLRQRDGVTEGAEKLWANGRGRNHQGRARGRYRDQMGFRILN